MRSKTLVLAAIVALSAGLAGPATAVAAGPRLEEPRPCAHDARFTCSTLTVPLDHRGRTRGTLKLQVATANNADAPREVLLFLTGGPGQPGVPFSTGLFDRMPEVFAGHRLVMIDQRGTGANAIDCPELQAQVGSSDIEPPTREAVTACAAALGDKARFYGSDSTVADLDLLRRALGARKMVVDGVSYGSLTAARYAVAHPGNVSKVILDSVLPHHATIDQSLYLQGLKATARVLRDACAKPPACGSDPAEDLAWLVRNRDTAAGVALFDMIVTYEFVDPTYRNPSALGTDLITALRAARDGDTAKLDSLLRNLASGGDPLTSYSSGLHAATLCTDMRFPWGDAGTPAFAREPLLKLAGKRLSARDTWPFTAAVATGVGFVQTCLPWPVVPPSSNPVGKLPDVPVLLLNGDHDLSTPMEWAYEEAKTAPRGKVVIVEGAAHSIQNREPGDAGRKAVAEFLAG
ncbi:alpha/beta fold hydrolase [Amycolatopsis oliviviridis]|uniref:prolyl aminopeptidase n=1 Tax=Amycolatopsis oliviviridis TaxID=1471590 RepID=A0ABQ3L957_9PSEU|nr:alpha/beta fold hydrolase [Amycolatopsis oliviviridis]GHH02632.1 esterase [Amycolatopsis oliviviridis]